MSLKSKAITGVKWTTVSMVALTLFQFLQLSILARYLTPQDFGLMALIMVVIGFTQTFMDAGISNAIIHKQNITNEQLTSLYWLNVVLGAFLSFIVAILSSLISSFYNEPEMERLLLLLSPVFFFLSLGSQYKVLCQKELKFNLMAKVEFVSAFFSFASAIYLAVNGYGVFSLVIAFLIQSTISTFLYVSIGIKIFYRPKLHFNILGLNEFFRFGFFQMGEKAVNYISANLDRLIIGKMIGAQSLGYYNLAWQLVMFPLSKINPVVNKVAFPIYSKVQDDNVTLSKYYNLSVSSLSLVTVPLLAFLSFFSVDVVEIVFGSQWGKAADLLTILAFIGILKALANPGGAVLLALGRADIGFWWNIFWVVSVSLTIMGSIMYFGTVESVAASLLILNITVGLLWHWIISIVSEVSYIDIFKNIIKISLFSFGISSFCLFLVDSLGLENSFFRVFISVFVCFLFYFPYVYYVHKDILRYFKKV